MATRSVDRTFSTSEFRAVLLGALALLVVVTSLVRRQTRALIVGDVAPNFRATVSGTNRDQSLADLKGKVVILSVVTGECGLCLGQLSDLQSLQDSLRGSGRVLVVSDDTLANNPIAATIEQRGLTIELLRDPRGAVQRAYQARGYPEVFAIDRDGVLRNHWMGLNHWSLDESMKAVRVLSRAD